MTRSPRIVSAFVCLAAVLPALASVSELLRGAGAFPRRVRAQRVLEERERRLEVLRPLLPRGEPVGYVSVEDGELGAKGAAERYFRSAYALAPVLLQYGTGPRRVVGNFAEPAPADLLARRKLRVVRDFGGGLVLLERRGPG